MASAVEKHRVLATDVNDTIACFTLAGIPNPGVLNAPVPVVITSQQKLTTAIEQLLKYSGNKGLAQCALKVFYKLWSDIYAHVSPETRCHLPCRDRKSTRLNSSHLGISYAVFC